MNKQKAEELIQVAKNILFNGALGKTIQDARNILSILNQLLLMLRGDDNETNSD